MYPGNKLVEDENAFCIWQPERENSRNTFLINLYTMKQVVGQDTATKSATRREMRWAVRTEFCPSARNRDRLFHYPANRLGVKLPCYHDVHTLYQGTELRLPQQEHTGPSRKPVDWEMFTSKITKDATHCTWACKFDASAWGRTAKKICRTPCILYYSATRETSATKP